MSETATNANTTLQVFSSMPVVLNFGSFLKNMSDEEFFEFCQRNRDWRIERTKEGDLVIMAPAGTETGGINFELSGNFWAWAKQNGTGKGFDSSTGFTLPNGAERSPDLSWIRLERWNAVPKEKRKKFASICPDFVVEIRSESDSLKKLKAKMEEYIENGAQLGWLIDPTKKKVYVYRPNTTVEVLDNPKEVSGEPLLKGFVLKMKEIWEE
jgi:Uma2 family endonuclease